MIVDGLAIYKSGREEITPIGRAVQRLEHHPYGNLQVRYQEWLERPTVALLVLPHKLKAKAGITA